MVKKTQQKEVNEQSSFTKKPSPAYLMTKSTKRMLALMPFRDVEDRNMFRQTMIQAELAAIDARNKPWSMSKKEKDNVSDRT